MFNANISSISAISTNHSNKRVEAVKASFITEISTLNGRAAYYDHLKVVPYTTER
jgi:hypothetical protein